MNFNKYKQILAGGLLSILCLSSQPEIAFASDLSSETLSTFGISVPYSSEITRGQFAEILFTLSGSNTLSTAQSPFSDVASSRSDAKSITAVYNLGLLNGCGDGTFAPDRAITLGEAVTSVLRLLEYTSADIGYRWPEDYVAKGQDLALLEAVGSEASSTLSTSQVEQLVYNILTGTDRNGEDFIENFASSTVENAILLSQAGQVAVLVNGNTIYYSSEVNLSSNLFGTCRGTLLLNNKGNISGFLPSQDHQVEIRIGSTTALGLFDTEKNFYNIQTATTVILEDSKSTYGVDFFALEDYSTALICYDTTGVIDLIFAQNNTSLDEFIVTGYYEDASPNSQQPRTVTVMGCEFDVEPDIAYKFSRFDIGDRLHLVLNSGGKVENVLAYSKTTAEPMIGIASNNMSSVTLLNGITLSGNSSDSTASSGQMVEVMPLSVGEWLLTPVNSIGNPSLDLAEMKLGNYSLSEKIKVYECVGSSSVSLISLEEIALSNIPSKDVEYYKLDDNGQVELLLLDNVTGNRYLYGIVEVVEVESGSNTYEGILLHNGDGSSSEIISDEFTNGEITGILLGDSGSFVSKTTLTSTASVALKAFSGSTALNSAGKLIPIADDVSVYHSKYEKWITLSTAFAECSVFTCYYDKTPEEGGKIRLILAQ